MKGVLRTIELFHTSSRIQPWLLGVGSVTFIVTHSAPYAALCGRAASSFLWSFLPSMLSINLIAMSVSLGALNIRKLSSRRTLTLIPWVRMRLLLGLLLAPLLPAAVIIVPVMLQHHGVSPGWGSPRGTLQIACASALLFVIWMFMAVRSAAVWLLPAVACLALTAIAPRAFASGEILDEPTADVLCFAAAIVVTVFSTWYLTARSIEPPNTRGWEGIDFFPKNRPVRALRSSRNAALETYLLETPSLLRAVRPILAQCALVNVAATVIFGFGWYHSHGRHGFTLVPFVTLFTTVMLGNQWVTKIAQRSRRVWIHGGESRAEIFRLCERLAWAGFATFGVPVLIGGTLEWIALPQVTLPVTDYSTIIFSLLSLLTLSACGLYLGLLAFRARPLDQVPFMLVTAAVYITMVGYLPYFASDSLTLPLEWCILIALTLGAFILRMVAAARYQRIDWLNVRPKERKEHATRGWRVSGGA